VGGSSGHGCIALAQSFPDLDFIVQDLAKVVEKGENELRKRDDVSDQVKSRIRFKPFNFFESQPESDADIYIMRQILHDWPDEEAKTILRNLRPAMKPTAKLLIMETVLPQPGVLGLSQETIMRSRDMLMHEMLNAHERELDEWARLLEEVDADWQIKQVRQPFGSNVAIIEVVFR
jgi:6-hydroxytryprostatin B O-methyltransferase